METLNNYLLTTLNGTPYLLPYGQGVASFSRGLRLNETGALVIRSLSHEKPFDWFAENAGISSAEMEEAHRDYDGFRDLLADRGCLQTPGFPFRVEENEPQYGILKIGPLSVRLKGAPDLFADTFTPFLENASAGSPVEQTICVTHASPPDITGSVLLVKSPDLEVFQRKDLFFLRFPAMRDIFLAVLSGDGAHACYHVAFTDVPERQSALREDLFHAIRQSFLYLAQRMGFFALHSATILYRDRVWAFSGPSGTGKSTHAALWKEQFGVPLMNGDLSLLSLAEDGSVRFHGMPWCGTSGIYTKTSAPLGGIVFLRQAPENRVETLPPEQEILSLLNRLISPVWTEEMLQMNLLFSTNAAKHLGIWRLHCTKEANAAFTMKEAIDCYCSLLSE